MKKYRIIQIDVVKTVFACEAKSKAEAEEMVLSGQAEEVEQGETVDRTFEIEEVK